MCMRTSIRIEHIRAVLVCVCVCVCLCACVCMRMYAYVRMCMYMAGTYVYAYVHMYVCMCVCVCVYVCEWQGYMCKCMHMCNNIHLHSAHLGIARMYLRCVCACARVSACVMCMRNPSASSTFEQSSTSLLPSPRTRTLHCV